MMMGLYDGINTKIMLKNNLNDTGLARLKKELLNYKLIVTFNGSSFDFPFIQKRYPDLLPRLPHFDVKSIARRAGFSGGLKEIERTIGIKRKPLIGKFNGGDASMLWRTYKATGNEYYINLLIEYNEDDIINLKKVADHAVKKLKDSIYYNLFPDALPWHARLKNNS